MRFRYSSLCAYSQFAEKTKLGIKIAVSLLCLSIATQASAELLFHDDFEKDKIGSEPRQMGSRTRRQNNR